MLTDTAIKNAKPRETAYKLSDAEGLYLYVATSGTKSWRLKYRFAGKEKVLTFGTYPQLSLVAARKARDAAKDELRAGKDPGLEKKRRKATAHASAGVTLESVARRWHHVNEPRWGETHARNVLTSLENDIFPELGSTPIAEIDVPLVMSALEKIQNRGAIETAHRIQQRLDAVFAFGIASGVVDKNPAKTVKGALKPVPKAKKYPAITDLEQLRDMLKAVEAASASPVTKLGHRLLALTAVRPGVIVSTPWEPGEFEDMDGKAPLWRIPPARMKLSKERKDEEAFEHLVPLPWQAVEAIKALHRLTGRTKYLLPNERDAHAPMSENGLNAILKRLGYKGQHVPHGYRSSFSTIMNEIAERAGRLTDRAVIDLMLAHQPENKVEGAYNRAAFMPRRREIAQAWADRLLEDFPPADALLKKR